MFGPLDKLGSPKIFYKFSEILLPYLSGIFVGLIVLGLIGGLWYAPIDYQQGNSYRIIFIHVPAAWLSMLIYTLMVIFAIMGLIWRYKMSHIFTQAAAPIGAIFTLITLITGSIWGKPTWGSFWVWDARLTSELILLFLYLGYIALEDSIHNRKLAQKSEAILLIFGFVNIPIIHFSVEWWNTLHQPATILKLSAPSIHIKMLLPLLIMALAFKVFFTIIVLMRMQTLLIKTNLTTTWVKELKSNE